jgi:curved DNA-binding protein CbpA
VDEVSDNRMFADPTDILGVAATPTASDIRKAKQDLALTYHPDKFHDLDALYRQIANRRMQEVNAAVDKIKNKGRS